jgi:putative ATP-dependent endonuclease of OLD family
MRIKRARVKNFRCLEDVEVHFDDVTTFIGPNGVGKSTVLRALDWFFNGSKGEPLQEDDLTHGSESGEISVEVEFDSLTDMDRAELGHYVPDGADQFIAWRFRTPGGVERMTANAKAYEPFIAVRTAGNASAIAAAYRALKTDRADLNLPAARSSNDVEDALRTWELAHPDELTDAPTELTTNFFGFNSQGKMAGLFDFVLVTADLRAKEEVLDNKSTVIGKILERAVDRTMADAEIADLAAEVQTRQQVIFDRNFQAQLDKLSDDLTKAVRQYSDGREVTVASEDIEIKPPKTQFKVTIADNDVTTSVTKQGHGFQRTLLISALQLLAQRGSAGGDNGTICLAIEEPELYQHPIQGQAFAQVLRTLAEDRTQGMQVAYATHSPYFIEAGKFHQVRRMSRVPAGAAGRSPQVIVKSTSVEVVLARLKGIMKESTVRNQLDSVALHRLPEALFASTAVLVEGTTERAVLEGLADRAGETPLSVAGVVIADTGSKTGFHLPRVILEELGVATYVMFDGDKECEARMRANNKEEKDILATVADHEKQNRELLSQLGDSPADWPADTVANTYAVLEDTLEAHLEQSWPEWTTAVDQIKSQGLGDPKKNRLLYKDATRKAEGVPSHHLTEALKAIRAL